MGRPKKNPDGTDALIEGVEESSILEDEDTTPQNDANTATNGGDSVGKGVELSLTKVKNPDVANRTVFGVTGKPVVFDSDGIAECDIADAKHFLSVPGYGAV